MSIMSGIMYKSIQTFIRAVTFDEYGRLNSSGEGDLQVLKS